MRILILLLVLACSHSGAVVGQSKRQNQQRQANQQVVVSPSPTPSVQPTVEIRETQVTGNEAERTHNITIVDERSPWPSRIANIISALLLAFVGYQAYVNKGMLKSMETNEGLLASQCKALTDLAGATQNQFDAMKRQLIEMRKQTGATHDQRL